MVVHQLSVFVENRAGRLYEITYILARNNIDIRAVSLSDTVEFGILRLIVSNPQLAEKVLKEEHFAVSITEVLAVKVTDTPGGLRTVLKLLSEKDISVEYVYAFISKSEDASVILYVKDVSRAAEVLTGAGVRLLNEVY